jgi:hypothetical protein
VSIGSLKLMMILLDDVTPVEPFAGVTDETVGGVVSDGTVDVLVLPPAAVVPPVAALEVPPVATLEVPPVAALEVPPVAALEVPPVATFEVPPVAALEVPPVAALEVPPVATLEVPPAPVSPPTAALDPPFAKAPPGVLPPALEEVELRPPLPFGSSPPLPALPPPFAYSRISPDEQATEKERAAMETKAMARGFMRFLLEL